MVLLGDKFDYKARSSSPWSRNTWPTPQGQNIPMGSLPLASVAIQYYEGKFIAARFKNGDSIELSLTMTQAGQADLPSQTNTGQTSCSQTNTY
ncbi:hypothetical protein E2C01_098667 [Portunus trituberculatus]|uniref:Uncharacterized protein n=1 Tax=Portunus trituberculatus TaxID=210409 RepID=A0A5B7K7I9_PORTR|nr:hypothetical protein [Portunus trituberculatus]